MKSKCSILGALKCCTQSPACGYSLSSFFFRWMTPCGHTWWLHSFFLELHQTETQWVEHSWTVISMLESLNGKHTLSFQENRKSPTILLNTRQSYLKNWRCVYHSYIAMNNALIECLVLDSLDLIIKFYVMSF